MDVIPAIQEFIVNVEQLRIAVVGLFILSVLFVMLFVREKRRSRKDRRLIVKWNVPFKERRWKEKMDRNKKK